MHPDAPSSVTDRPSTACRLVESYLEQCIGLDSQTVGSNAIAGAARRRMESCGVTDERTFVERLTRDPDEHARLIDEVTVPESWFFRDPGVFRGLRDVAVRWAATSITSTLRVLCAPCAAGEEPYSVAMTLLDSGLAEHRFRIDAMDVSHVVLARATAGSYSDNAFRGDTLAFCERWFHLRGKQANLDEFVRKQVHFFQGNLLDETVGADRGPYDVIFCRNLLIYLTTEARARVVRTIERLLDPGGLLIVGAAEPSILMNTRMGVWFPAAPPGAFTLRRGTEDVSNAPAAPRPQSINNVAGPQHATPEASPSVTPTPGRAAPAEGEVSPGESRLPALEDLLQEAHALADAGKHADALAACERYRQVAGPSAQVFFLMAMLHQTGGDVENAEALLLKTLYMDPDRDDAFLALSRLAEQRGDHRMAALYRQSAARVLGRKGTR